MKILVDVSFEDFQKLNEKYGDAGGIDDKVQLELRSNLDEYLANAQIVSSH